MTTTIGIIGAGHLIKHMMPAMAKTGSRFLVSERGREISAELAAQYGVEVLSDNQSIVDQSEIVVVAVRPFDAVEVCEALTFADGQTVLSLCAGLPSSDLGPVVAPAVLVMAMPVVAAEFSESPTLIFPENLTVPGAAGIMWPGAGAENRRQLCTGCDDCVLLWLGAGIDIADVGLGFGTRR